MHQRSWTAATLFIVAVPLAISHSPAPILALIRDETPAAAVAASQRLFGLDKVHDFHIEVAAKQWDKMQPAGGMGFPGGPFGFGGPKQAPGQGTDKSADIHKGGSFGIEFPWVHATLSAAG